uniref:Centrosomal protein 89 n=1 Tax=Gasterosteus aculeatus aculeatus TaxID=481459 RepID=A0AAQ4R287_GASAC
MFKFNFRREKDNDFKHIAHGLVPAASVAPKAAVPRTPPPRSPHPSPERPRSALAAAILTSSLTGQTWALPPLRPRSYSQSGRSESFISEPNVSPELFNRDRWSEDLSSRPRLSSPDHSEEELEDNEEEEESEKEREEHLYQTVAREENCSITDPIYSVPLKPKVRLYSTNPFKGSGSAVLTGGQAELLNLRRQAQELVDENDALKMTVHRLNVELSRYQTLFRPLSKQESSRISGLPKTGSPPPWLLDMKYLSPLVLAYEDRINEKDALLQTTEEEVKRLRVHVEDVIKENEKLHVEIAKIEGVSKKNCHQLQEQALLVLQENQVLIDQLEAQHVKAKASHSRHHSEVTKVSKQLMLLEAERQRLQEDLEESRRELQKHVREVQVLQSRLKDAVTWDEHCSMDSKLRRYGCNVSFYRWKNKRRCFLTVLFIFSSFLLVTHIATYILSQCFHTGLLLSGNSFTHLSFISCITSLVIPYFLVQIVCSTSPLRSVTPCPSPPPQTSVLQQEKQGFVSRILNGTIRFGKLQEEVKQVYRSQATTRLAGLEEAAEGRTASYQREILHLQRLLTERQEAEERLLQSKREVEEDLEVLWQAATRENQQMRGTLTADLHGRVSPDRPPQAAEAPTISAGPLVFTSHQSPGLLRRSGSKCDSDHQDNSLEERHKHGLDFYC